MALKRRSVVKLNNIVLKYLDQLGMTEQAKQDFQSKSIAMIRVDSFMSVWFEKMTTRLYQVLHEMGERGLDLNEPVIEDDEVHNIVYHPVVAAVEDERRRDTAIKRKRRAGSQHSSGPKLPPSTALRIHENEVPPSGSASGMPNPNNVRPFDHKHKNKATLILVSDSDTESD